MTLVDIGVILGVALASAVATELVNWYLVYRHAEFQEKTERLSKLEARLAELKKNGDTELSLLQQVRGNGGGGSGGKDKKAQQITELTEAQQRLSMELQKSRLVSMLVMAGGMITLMYMLNSIFAGHPVARLPFEPSGFIAGLTHRGLLDNDYTMCSLPFVYMLSAMTIRGNLSKLLGTTAANPLSSMSLTPQ